MENNLVKRVNNLEMVTKILTEVSTSQEQNQNRLVDVMNFIANGIGDIITTQVDEQLQAYEERINGKFEGVDVEVKEIHKVIKSEEITATQAGSIEKARRMRVMHITGSTRTDKYKIFYSAYFSALGQKIKDKFKDGDTPLIAFKNIKREKYDAVINYINDWNPDEQTKRDVINDLLILRDKVDEWEDKINSGKISEAKKLEYALKINKNEKKIKAFKRYLNKEAKKNEI